MTAKILYIEDNPDNMVLVRRVLMVEGYTIIEASSAREGIQLAEAHQPDLILLDINMPEMDGLTAVAYLRQIPGLENVPMIALTANVMRGALEAAEEAGCDGYIAKPIDVDRFPEQIYNYLCRRR
jgi:two-component system, cell cycle response regulator DivK